MHILIVLLSVIMTTGYNNGIEETAEYKKTSIRESDTNQIYAIHSEGEHKRSFGSNLKQRHREKRESHFEDPCYKYGFCDVNNDSSLAVCYCDDLCVYFGDCCNDVVLDTVDNGTISNLPNITLMKCVRKAVFDIMGYWMIAGCPSEYDNKVIASLCNAAENYVGGLPAFDHNGIVYANAHCATCNNVTDYQLATIKYDLTLCQIHQPNWSATHLSKLHCAKYKHLPPSDYQFRNCYMTASTAIENKQCRLRQNPLIYSSGLLKSYHCGNVSIEEEYICFKDGFSVKPPWFYDIFPLTVLITFKAPVIREDTTCNDETTLDSHMGICMETVCYDDWTLSNGMCESDPIFLNYQLMLKYSFKSNQPFDGQHFIRTSIVLAFSFITYSYRIYPTDMEFYSIQEANKTEAETSGWMVMLVRLSNWLRMEEIEDIKTKMDNISITYEEKDIYTGLVKNKIIIETFNLNESDTVMFKDEDDYKIAKRIKTQDYYRDYGHNIKTAPYFNVYDDELCLDVSISAWMVNDSAIILEKNMSNLATFEIYNEILAVNSWTCKLSSPILQTPRRVLKSRSISFQTILTYVCMGLSCIALTLAISIYKHLSFSETIPGSNTLNVLVSLLLSHVFFLVGIGANDHQIICTCVGVLIHFFWLSHFAFMTISTVHMSLTFTKLSKRPNVFGNHNASLKWKLTVLGYCTSLLFVVPSLVVEYVNLIPIRVGYNGAICFPTEYPATIIFVSSPIVLSVFINVSCLTLGIYSICRQTADQKLIDKNKFFYFLVYIRLAILSGILWIFGILSALFPSPVIQIIFILLVGLQGFFVSISSTCTVRVYRSLRSCSSTDTSNKIK